MLALPTAALTNNARLTVPSSLPPSRPLSVLLALLAAMYMLALVPMPLRTATTMKRKTTCARATDRISAACTAVTVSLNKITMALL